MRHGNKLNHLGRTAPHRKAMMANMASSLIMHKRITTTLAKAKALRTYAEPLITKSKDDTTHSRRTVFAYLKQAEAVKELFAVVAPKIADRPGGYTRVLKLMNRQGDNAEMAIIELVDFNEAMLALKTTKTTAAKKTRRGRAKKEETVVAETSKDEVAE
jgi:large subunit ribosomal protein L17